MSGSENRLGEDQLLANTRRFTELTGVEVRIDSGNVEELRPKAAVAAEVGAGSVSIRAREVETATTMG